MSDFLRLLAPRHADALRPAAPLRAMAAALAPMADAREPADEPEAAVITPRRFDPVKSRTTGAEPEHPRIDALPRETRERTIAAVPTPLAPSAVRDLASGAMPGGSPAPPRNDGAGADDPRIAGFVPAASQPSARDQSAFEPHPAHEHARRDTIVSMPSPLPRSEAMPERPAAPLSAATVALLAPVASPAPPPAIHISIDRIEVRAPTQPAKPHPPRPRAVPGPQSLHDYLHRKPLP